MANPTLSQKVLNLLANLDQNTSTNPNGIEDYGDLINYINHDDTLINQLNTDVGDGYDKAFNWSTQAGSAAFFNQSNDSININVAPFQSINPAVTPYTETFVLGHELSHSEFAVQNLTNVTPDQAQQNLADAVGSGTTNLTSAIQAYEGNYNYNESQAQLEGFNSAIDEYYTANNIVNPTTSQIQAAYKAVMGSGYGQYFLKDSSGTYVLDPGLTTDDSGTGALLISLTNMAAEGNYYYLNSSVDDLGIFGDKNYTNYNGTSAIDVIVGQDLTNGNYSVDGSQITIIPPIQVNFADPSQTNPNSGLTQITQSFGALKLAQDLGAPLGSILAALPQGATSLSFTAKDTSTGDSYVYTINEDGGVSSVVSTKIGSTTDIYIGDSAPVSGTTYQADASKAAITIASGYTGQLDGSNNTVTLQNTSDVDTQTGDSGNHVICGTSSATINGASDDSCLIGKTDLLTLSDDDITGSNLAGNVVLDGSGDSFSAKSGASVETEAGDADDTITCGSSSATITGVSTDVCSIAGTTSKLTVNGPDDTGNLAGNVVLTESGDTFSANSNANITMASGDIINVGAGTSGVQLTCGSSTETVTGGASGSDSVLCTITSGTGDFTNNGSDLQIGNAGVGDFNLTGSDDTFVDIATGTVTGGSSNINLFVAGSNNNVTMGNNSYLGLNSGTYNIFNLSGSTVVAQNNTGADITGSADDITANVGNFTLTGNGSTFDDSATGTVTGGDTNISLFVAGSDNNVTMGNNSYLGLNSGTGDVFDLSNSTVVAQSSTSAGITGSNDNITANIGDFTLTGNDNVFDDSATGTITSGSSNIDVNVAGSNNDITMGNDSYLGLNSGTGNEFNLSDGTVTAGSNVGGLFQGSNDTLNTDGGTFTLNGSGFTVNENHSSGNATTDWLDASSSADIDGVDQSTNSSYLESLNYNGSAQETAQTQFSASSGWELNNTNYNPSTGYDENQTIYGNILDGKDYETQYTDFNADGDSIQQDNWATNTYLYDVDTSNGSTAYYTTEYFTSSYFNGDSPDKYFQVVDDFNGTTGAELQSDGYNATSGALDDAAFFDGGNYADKIDFTQGSDPYFWKENTYNTSNGDEESSDIYNGDTGDLQETVLFDGSDPYCDEEEFTTGTDPYFSTIDVFNPLNGKEEYDDSYNPVTGGFYGRTYYNGYSSGGGYGDGSDGGYGFSGGDGGYGAYGIGSYGYGGYGYDDSDSVGTGTKPGQGKNPGRPNQGRIAAAGQIDQALAGTQGASAGGGSPVQSDSTTSATLSSAQQAALTAWSMSSSASTPTAVEATSTSVEASHAIRTGEATTTPALTTPKDTPISLNPNTVAASASLSPPSNLHELLHAMAAFGVAGNDINADTAFAGVAFNASPAGGAIGHPASLSSNVVQFPPLSGAGPTSATMALSPAPNLHRLIYAMSAFGGGRDGAGLDMAFTRPMLEDQHLLVMAR